METNIQFLNSNTIKVDYLSKVYRACKSHLTYLAFCLVIFHLSACEKFVDVPTPSTSVTGQSAFNSDATGIAVLNGIYDRLSSEPPSALAFSHISTWISGLYSDEFTLWEAIDDVTRLAYYKNDLSAIQGTGKDAWLSGYNYIYTCNSTVEGLLKPNTLTKSVRDQLMGEAKFMRAFFYFYLVNLYGDIPLVLTTDYALTTSLLRTSEEEIYTQIIKDLKEAESFLSENYLDGALNKVTTERVRPTKAAARAFLARIYLFKKDWTNAELYSSQVIGETSKFGLEAISNAFLKNKKEAIWQLQPTAIGFNTQDGALLVIPSDGLNGINCLFLNDDLLNSFEDGDMRRTKWIDSVLFDTKFYKYAAKYKIGIFNSDVNSSSSLKEYLMMLRISEQFLIRAEARAKQGNISGAIDDINLIRKRARALPTVQIPNPLPDLLKSLNADQVISAVVKERRNELFSEWGHRWFDIKRLHLADSIMKIATAEKGGEWQSYKILFPIPQDEIRRNPKLSQNFGY